MSPKPTWRDNKHEVQATEYIANPIYRGQSDGHHNHLGDTKTKICAKAPWAIRTPSTITQKASSNLRAPLTGKPSWDIGLDQRRSTFCDKAFNYQSTILDLTKGGLATELDWTRFGRLDHMIPTLCKPTYPFFGDGP